METNVGLIYEFRSLKTESHQIPTLNSTFSFIYTAAVYISCHLRLLYKEKTMLEREGESECDPQEQTLGDREDNELPFNGKKGRGNH